MTIIEETKKYGAMTALYRAVDDKLWAARENCEEARKHEGMRYNNLPASIAAARKSLDEAEAFFNELQRDLDSETHTKGESRG